MSEVISQALVQFSNGSCHKKHCKGATSWTWKACNSVICCRASFISDLLLSEFSLMKHGVRIINWSLHTLPCYLYLNKFRIIIYCTVNLSENQSSQGPPRPQDIISPPKMHQNLLLAHPFWLYFGLFVCPLSFLISPCIFLYLTSGGRRVFSNRYSERNKYIQHKKYVRWFFQCNLKYFLLRQEPSFFFLISRLTKNEQNFFSHKISLFFAMLFLWW